MGQYCEAGAGTGVVHSMVVGRPPRPGAGRVPRWGRAG